MTPRAGTESGTIQPGTVVGGYRVLALAGRGEMGEVYRASGPGGDVALKLIEPWLARDPGFRARFRNEAAVAGGLAHPNVVPVHGVGEDGGRLYLAMGWIDGDDLATRVERDGPLAPAAAARVVADVAAALDAAHARGLVHRDVKPGNVIVGRRAFLTDFGLAKTGATRTGQFISSAGYVAPEQVRGAPAGPATDVYALGCVLLFALTGAPPFPAGNDLETLRAHVEAPPPAATARVPGLPPAIDAVLAHALAKDPEDRYTGARELSAAVDAAFAGGAVLAPVRPVPTRPRRRRVALAAAAVLGAAAVAAAVVVATGADGDRPAVEDAPGVSADAGARDPSPSPAAAGAPAPRRVATIPVGRGAAGLAVHGGRVWVTNPRRGTLTRIDPARDAVAGRPLRTGAGARGVTVGSGVVWVANRAAGTVARVAVRPRTALERTSRPGRAPAAVALGVQLAWVANAGDDTVARLDRATGDVIGDPIGVGRRPSAVHVGASGVWVADSGDDAVSRLDVATATTVGAPIPVGDRPSAVLEVGGTVWVANAGDGTVARIDARTGRPAGPPVAVGREPVALVHGRGAIWVANRGDGTVTRIDAAAGRVTGAPVRIGGRPAAVAFGAGSLWAADPAAGTVTRVRP